MSETEILPELKQIVGAMLFAAKGSVSPGDIRRCLKQVAEERGGPYRAFAEVSERDLHAAIEELRAQVRDARIGVHINEVASGYRMENDATCGPWLRALLQKGRASRLSRPALETLAVIAYRQPCTRAEIEAVRGVAVDQILRNLIDLQLIRITGRSELPGRPWLFGTTQKFLEYFGLKDVNDLPGVDELRRMEAEQESRKADQEPGAPSPGESANESESVPPAGADDNHDDEVIQEGSADEYEADDDNTFDDEDDNDDEEESRDEDDVEEDDDEENDQEKSS